MQSLSNKCHLHILVVFILSRPGVHEAANIGLVYDDYQKGAQGSSIEEKKTNWSWIDGSPYSWTAWAHEEPSRNDRLGVLIGYKWSADYYIYKYYFICEHSKYLDVLFLIHIPPINLEP